MCVCVCVCVLCAVFLSPPLHPFDLLNPIFFPCFANRSTMDGLAAALSAALNARSVAVHGSGSEDDDDEWSDDEA